VSGEGLEIRIADGDWGETVEMAYQDASEY
jgi:hypothetical protein